MPGSETVIISPAMAEMEQQRPQGAAGHGDLTEGLIASDQWSDEMVAGAGIPIVEVPLISIGAGIGSFVLFDHLRIAGVPKDAIRVLGVNDVPWQTYEYLCRNSQIPRGERLRSDAQSTPDNIWGFPSYAIREAWKAKGLGAKLDPLWNVVTEPIFRDYYTPRAGDVFTAIEREMKRVGYQDALVKGLVRMTRKRLGGGYFTILTPPEGTTATRRIAYKSLFVHVAVGYPGLRFLPDLQEYRQTHQDYVHLVNAYEPHEHVYEQLNHHPGTVILRGGGIVASRVLQRLIDDRDRLNNGLVIHHLFRTYVDRAQGPDIFNRRKGANGWSYQGFNWPKAAWTGQYKKLLEHTEGAERAALYDLWGGTTTPRRRSWIAQLNRGRKEGWYRPVIGEVGSVVPHDGGTLTKIKSKNGLIELASDFIIDATGLEADIREHRYLADLFDHSGIGSNPKGRLDCDLNFEIRGAASQGGAMFASGSPTLGAYFAGVDSFLGLQYAALAITDELGRRGFCKKLTPLRSTSEWIKWARNTPI